MVQTLVMETKTIVPTLSLIRQLAYSWKNKPNLALSLDKRTFQTKCWKCGIERKRRALFCDKCNMIQNPDVRDNYFRVFELEERFDIDLKALRDKYRQLQSVLHPDKFTTKTDEEKGISEEYSSLLNKAFNNLQTPISRAVHLLNLRGVKIAEEQKIQDPEFLMEIMEINEEIDAADTTDKIRNLDDKNKTTMELLGKQIDVCFKANDLNGAQDRIIKLKYFGSIGKRINEVMREQGIVD